VMLALSIYLATQSFSAWAHRLLFIGVPTILLWKYWIAGQVSRRVPVGSAMPRYRPDPRAAARQVGARGVR
jgi:hypothetical protein